MSATLQHIRDLVMLMTPSEVHMVQLYLNGNLNEVPSDWQATLEENECDDERDDERDLVRARNVYEVRDLVHTLPGPEITVLKYYLQGDLSLDPARLIGKTEALASLEEQVLAQGEYVRTLKRAKGDRGSVVEAVNRLVILKTELSKAMA